MLFNSLNFCLFFVIVSAVYYLLPWRWRWKMLLLSSCIFYMFFVPAYILILALTIVIDYAMGIQIARATSAHRRKLYLIISIISTCLVLFVFKYFNFFADSSNVLLRILGIHLSVPVMSVILPIGLSFHTFQSLSYVIEVYKRRQEPERNFGIYSLYVMFYPQLVAGPIERPQNLIHQFYEDHRFDVSNIVRGLTLMAWGYFMKMAIADRAGHYIKPVYDTWSIRSGSELLIATALFAIRIYADFAGYSCIAIGAARVMGFKLMTNFNRPYLSTSVSEFWRRWHISLSTWFKDYVYIPLGGSRVSIPRHYVNLLITFTISGLWHGANWTFIIWGFYNGALLVLEQAAGKWWHGTNLIWTTIRRAVTLTLICIGWVFFRAPNARAAFGILRRMATLAPHVVNSTKDLARNIEDETALPVLASTLLLIAAMFAVELIIEKRWFAMAGRFQDSLAWNSGALILLANVIFLLGVMQPSAFIYFQF